MIPEPREVSEDEALEARPSTRSVAFKPVARTDLAWHFQVGVLASYCVMWYVWNVVALSPWRRLRRWASGLATHRSHKPDVTI